MSSSSSRLALNKWPRCDHDGTLSILLPPIENRGDVVCKYDACADRCLRALNVIHLDFLALKITLNSVANLSHTASIVRIARAVGANKTTSSAYASAATNQLPIKHPTPAFFSSMRT
jgi:hypothetical protein